MRFHSGQLWIRVNGAYGQRRISGGDHRQERVCIYAFDTDTMTTTASVKDFVLKASGAWSSPAQTNCYMQVQWLLVLTASSALVTSAVWLILARDTPCGVAPLVAASYLLLASLDNTAAFLVASVSVLAVVFLMLRKRSSRNGQNMNWIQPYMMTDERACWTLYTLCSCMVIAGTTSYYLEWENICGLALFLIVGFLLNHPILQCMGWFSGFLSIFFIAFAPPLFLVGLVWSVGMITAGNYLQKYRAYIVWQLQRLRPRLCCRS